MTSMGALVPFAVVGDATGDDLDFSGLTDGLVLIPAAAYDYAASDREYFGVEVSVLNTFTTSSPAESTNFGVFVNPRWELGLTDQWSLGVDLNLGYLQNEDDDGDIAAIPFFSPAVGVRGYLPTGFGGLVWTQQLSIGGIVFGLPGSLAYDVPLDFDGPTLHVFPEFRYDPTVFITSEQSGVLAMFSGGVTFMLEM